MLLNLWQFSAKFLRSNLGFTTELISGVKLAPYQEIHLKALMNRNFNMCVFGRGCGKSFIAAVFCFLQCVFEPNTKILIAGPTFRTARFIFNNLEKIVESSGAELLAQCFGAKAKRNDQFEWQINGGRSCRQACLHLRISEGHPKHKGMNYFLASKVPGKAGSKTTSSGNFSPP
jgi:hypothetical protein